jgi:hypothetical protein
MEGLIRNLTAIQTSLSVRATLSVLMNGILQASHFLPGDTRLSLLTEPTLSSPSRVGWRWHIRARARRTLAYRSITAECELSIVLAYSTIMRRTTQIYIPQLRNGGTRWISWLRHCATSRKVAGSIRLDFSVDLFLPVALWSWGRLSS